MELPEKNRRLKLLVEKYADGNVSEFSRSINFVQQKIDRLFKIDKRTNKFPKLTEDVVKSVVNKYPDVNIVWLETGIGSMLISEADARERSVRKPKTVDNPEVDGIIFVPIAAQAGYTQLYTDPIYLNQLERVYIPGFPYRGPRYRIFEVNGESMEPTFKEGFHLVAETIDKDSWHQIADYYIYVIVLENEILTKRLFKKSESEFVAISDNEEFFPQFIINKADIKELWLVKRKLDWVMPPPKRFKISI